MFVVYTRPVVRSLASRLLLLTLAVLPAVWGTCPCWLFGETGRSGCVGVSASAGSSVARRDDGPGCPCCVRRDDARRLGTSPMSGRDDQRRKGCDGCPVIEVRHGATQAPVSVTLPDAERLAALPVAGPAVECLAAPIETRGGLFATGPPPRPVPLCERLVGSLLQLV